MRNLTGFCSTIGGATVTPPFTAAFPASATGGPGAAPVAAAALAQYSWPPIMSASGSTTYRYTATQAQITMPAFSPTPNSAAGVASTSYVIGNGWANAQDTALFYTLSAGQACASASRLRSSSPADLGHADGDAWGLVEPGGTPIQRRHAARATPTPAPQAKRA